MPSMDAPLKLGALCWNQYTDWASFLEAGKRAEKLGFHSLWTWDHLYPDCRLARTARCSRAT